MSWSSLQSYFHFREGGITCTGKPESMALKIYPLGRQLKRAKFSPGRLEGSQLPDS